MTMTRRLLILSLAGVGWALTAHQVQAVELNLGTSLPPVDIHGFVSQGLLESNDYNYLGESSRGSFKFTEAGLNASINPFPRTRISAQAFTFDVGPAGEYDVFLDYGQVEYTFGDYLGIGAGAHGKLTLHDRVLRQMRWKQPKQYLAKVAAATPVQWIWSSATVSAEATADSPAIFCVYWLAVL